MSFIEHDYMVEQIATAGTPKTFGHAVLQGLLKDVRTDFMPRILAVSMNSALNVA